MNIMSKSQYFACKNNEKWFKRRTAPSSRATGTGSEGRPFVGQRHMRSPLNTHLKLIVASPVKLMAAFIPWFWYCIVVRI
jgi:hypothetical protein